MHILSRIVRFSVNPFLPIDVEGFNSFACKPTGQGLSIFLELIVNLTGQIDRMTGFLINVSDIDRSVRRTVVPIFAENIRKNFNDGKHVGFAQIIELLKLAWSQLNDSFVNVQINKLSLNLNPYRKIVIVSKEAKMVYFSEKFEFAAMHKLWNEEFSQQRNLEVFGKCANPRGHGHNYIVEVTIKKPSGNDTFSTVEFERIVDEEFIKLVDHKNLNVDVDEFRKNNPTVENIASLAWEKLVDKFGSSKLHCVTIWESERTSCSYYG